MRHRFLRNVLAGLLGVIAFLSAISYAEAAGWDFWWTTGADVSATRFNRLDGDPALIKEGTNLWFYFTAGGLGTQAIYRFKGTTMDNMVQQPDGTKDSSFKQPYGDDKYWMVSGWRDAGTGKWFATVHVEFHYGGGNPFRRIGLATSTNQGATWHYEGDIITSDSSYNKSDYATSYFNDGQGDEKLFVDSSGGYFYLFYRNDWINKWNFDDRTSNIRVARCPISSKMMPGCWKKWYNGGWTETGLRGHESNLVADADSMTVFRSDSLGKFVGVGVHVKGGGNFVAQTGDLSSENWTLTPFCGDRLRWYNFAVNPSTWSMTSVGQTFRLYSSDVGTSGPTKYMNVTVYPGATAPSCTPGTTYVFEPVADSYINSANPNSSAGGSSASLLSDGNPIQKTFIRFNLTALAGKTIKNAQLQVRTTADSAAGSADAHYLHYVANDQWKEAYMSYNNSVPASSIYTAILGRIPASSQMNSFYSTPLDALTVGKKFGQYFSLEIEDATGTDGLRIYSREAGTRTNRPLLIITTY